MTIFIIAYHIAIAQTTISGQINESNGIPIIGAMVKISQIETDSIIGFGFSDNVGNYLIGFMIPDNEIVISVQILGYETVSENIANRNTVKNFVLQSKTFELKEVIVNASPIERNNDTLNYYVNGFAQENDRSLVDVLKRMPGIEVQQNGRILYQGTPINKYYIEGLDLLGGKYSLANNNLSHKEVTAVQILENHQPIKLLEKSVYSNNAALNIKLKKKNTLAGQSEFGGGLTPLLWSTNVTPMIFAPKKQMLVSYQSNNVGDDSSQELKILTREDLFEQLENNNTENVGWLSIQQVKNHQLSERRWLINNLHQFSGNALNKLNNDYNLRFNVSYLNDYQQQNGSSDTRFYSALDTIFLFENKYNQLFNKTFESEINVEKNTDKNYLKNNLKFEGFWNKQRGFIQTKRSALTQNLNTKFFNFNNNFKSNFYIKDQLVILNSSIRINQTPQNLEVNPGQFISFLNDGLPYNQLLQNLNLQTYNTNNSIGFIKGIKKLTFEPKIGFQIEKQKLLSDIKSPESQSKTTEFSNNLNLNYSKLYFKVNTQYRKQKWIFELHTPINLQNYRLEDPVLKLGEHLNRLTFEPRLSINYKANVLWKFNGTASINNQFGTIDQMHYGYILENYRSIKRINTPIPQMLKKTFSGSVLYNNPINSFFWNIFYTQSFNQSNLLYQTQIFNTGATEQSAILKDNGGKSQNISLGSGKFFRNKTTNIGVMANYGQLDFIQIINGSTSKVKNKNGRIGGKISTHFTDWLSTEYQSNILLSKNQINIQKNVTNKQKSQILNVIIIPHKNQYFSINGEYVKSKLFTSTTENFFLDLSYRFSIKNINSDFEVFLTNALNTKTYREIHISTFSYIENNLDLRQRQLFFKVKFSF
ncbi:MAG: hypothetical protein IPL23_13720 [Saprospiraceae bacterium]|nr:hypothetical protein [Saprospiraceae bacterium]